MRKLIQWFKDLKELVSLKNSLSQLMADYESLNDRVNDAGFTARCAMSSAKEGVDEIRKRTEVHVDGAYYKGQTSTVILAGRYRNRNFVRVYNTNEGHFKHLIHVLREEQKYARKGVMDIPESCLDIVDKEIW